MEHTITQTGIVTRVSGIRIFKRESELTIIRMAIFIKDSGSMENNMVRETISIIKTKQCIKAIGKTGKNKAQANL